MILIGEDMEADGKVVWAFKYRQSHGGELEEGGGVLVFGGIAVVVGELGCFAGCTWGDDDVDALGTELEGVGEFIAALNELGVCIVTDGGTLLYHVFGDVG